MVLPSSAPVATILSAPPQGVLLCPQNKASHFRIDTGISATPRFVVAPRILSQSEPRFNWGALLPSVAVACPCPCPSWTRFHGQRVCVCVCVPRAGDGRERVQDVPHPLALYCRKAPIGVGHALFVLSDDQLTRIFTQPKTPCAVLSQIVCVCVLKHTATIIEPRFAHCVLWHACASCTWAHACLHAAMPVRGVCWVRPWFMCPAAVSRHGLPCLIHPPPPPTYTRWQQKPKVPHKQQFCPPLLHSQFHLYSLQALAVNH